MGSFPLAAAFEILEPTLAVLPFAHPALQLAAAELAQGEAVRHLLDDLILKPALGFACRARHLR